MRETSLRKLVGFILIVVATVSAGCLLGVTTYIFLLNTLARLVVFLLMLVSGAYLVYANRHHINGVLLDRCPPPRQRR